MTVAKAVGDRDWLLGASFGIIQVFIPSSIGANTYLLNRFGLLRLMFCAVRMEHDRR
jgi:hypothetical protein